MKPAIIDGVEWIPVEPPENSTVVGCSYVVDPKLVDPSDLTEDMFAFALAGGTIDVGWYPDGNPRGEYICLVHPRDDQGRTDFETVVEEYRTRDPQNVVWFVNIAARKLT